VGARERDRCVDREAMHCAVVVFGGEKRPVVLGARRAAVPVNDRENGVSQLALSRGRRPVVQGARVKFGDGCADRGQVGTLMCMGRKIEMRKYLAGKHRGRASYAEKDEGVDVEVEAQFCKAVFWAGEKLWIERQRLHVIQHVTIILTCLCSDHRRNERTVLLLFEGAIVGVSLRGRRRARRLDDTREVRG
jgi:hypothetical protein